MNSDDDDTLEEGFHHSYDDNHHGASEAHNGDEASLHNDYFSAPSTSATTQGFEDVAEDAHFSSRQHTAAASSPSAFLREAASGFDEDIAYRQQQQSATRHHHNTRKEEEDGEDEEPLRATVPPPPPPKAEPVQSRKRGTGPAANADDLFQAKQFNQPPKPSLQTRVSDPKVVGESSLLAGGGGGSGGGSASSSMKKDKFVVYRIETQVNDATLSQVQFDGHSTFSVLRRFSDFDWLHAQLESKYLGFIIPPLPDKTVMLLQNNLSEQFYTTRARALDKFLTHVTSHSVLSRDSSVRDFLIAEQQRFESLRRGTMGGQGGGGSSMMGNDLTGGNSGGVSTAGGGGGGGGGLIPASVASGFFEKVLDWGNNLKEQVGTSFSGTAKMGAELRSKTSSDELFDDAVRYIEEMEPKLRMCFDISRKIVSQNTELAKAMHELGLAFTSVGQSEQNVELSRTITELGNVCGGNSGLSLMLNALVVEEEAKFLEPIEDYVRLISAAKQALAIRVKTCSAYEIALGELHFKREAKIRLAANSGNNTIGADAKMDQELSELERRAESAKSDFDLVTDRVVKEIDRFKREKARDFKSLILDYVQLQINHNLRVEQLWRSLLPRLGVMNGTE